jgi:hypothetical protein
MTTHAYGFPTAHAYPVDVDITPALDDRNRLSIAFRILLAVPHLILVGGPLAAGVVWERSSRADGGAGWSATGGVLGAVAVVAAIIAGVAILATGRYPAGLRDLASYYLRWRVRALAYMTLLTDEYPPFGDGPYPAGLALPLLDQPHDRLTVAFRPLLVIPHLIVLWVLGIVWAVATCIAWVAILFTGRHPRTLFALGGGMLRWTTRVEAYMLLLTDAYPPFGFS